MLNELQFCSKTTSLNNYGIQTQIYIAQ